MKHCDMQVFISSTYDSSPSQQQNRHRRRYAKPNQNRIKVKVDRPKGTFKYGLEVPKSWKSVIVIDRATHNTYWHDTVKKEVGTFVFHQCFDSKSPNYIPSKEYQCVRLH